MLLLFFFQTTLLLFFSKPKHIRCDFFGLVSFKRDSVSYIIYGYIINVYYKCISVMGLQMNKLYLFFFIAFFIVFIIIIII